MIPIAIALSTHSLGVFYSNTQGFRIIRERGVVEYTQKDDAGILLRHIRRFCATDASRHQKGQSGNSANLLPMNVVNLNERLLVSQRKDLAYVRGVINEGAEEFVGLR